MPDFPSILILGGGPDAERAVSLKSAAAITQALRSAGYQVHNQTIDRLTADQLAELPGEVIFPALHGGWGEGGPLQDLLEYDGRPFVGSMSQAARHAMDKIATKMTALTLGIPTPRAHILDPRDSTPPIAYPLIIKPIHEGSTIGLHICRSAEDWAKAQEAIDDEFVSGEARPYMIEPCITGSDGRLPRELTVGLLDGQPLPIIEITPAVETYDYDAKYERNDTRYRLDPTLPTGLASRIQQQTVELAQKMSIRHLARADFLVDNQGVAWFLEINTLPGFTDHSLVPMACRHLHIDMPALCTRLVNMAVRDHAGVASRR